MPKTRALIIEENRKILEQLRDSLEVAGFDTEIALSLDLGLEILSSRRIDLIVIDPGPEKPVLNHMLKTVLGLERRCPTICLVPEKLLPEFKKKYGRKVKFFKQEEIDLDPIVAHAKEIIPEE